MKPILMTKLKNEINKANANKTLALPLEFHLRNININDDKRGCSGFIVNTDNNSIVYVNTESFSYQNPRYLYRYADSIKDYTGYSNRFAMSCDELITNTLTLLHKTPTEAKDHRL